MLNKALAIPLMPEWAGSLWLNGSEAKLIELLDAGKGQSYAAWRVKTIAEGWQKIIQSSLQQKQIIF